MGVRRAKKVRECQDLKDGHGRVWQSRSYKRIICGGKCQVRRNTAAMGGEMEICSPLEPNYLCLCEVGASSAAGSLGLRQSH